MTAEPSAGTEARNPASIGLSEMSTVEVVELMNREETRVLDAVSARTAEIAVAASKVADVYRTGGTVFLIGAGTSGRLAAMEVAELPPTFGADPDRFVALVASKAPIGPAGVAVSEDDTEAAGAALAKAAVGPGDAVIGVAASGTTPFVVAGVLAACGAGAWTCGIANNVETPLLEDADLAVLLDTGPEVLTGSTRLKAGTAQKLVLNRITTTAFVMLGHVRSNLMVNAAASTDKLRRRCVRIVTELAEVDEETAIRTLDAVDWVVTAALTSLTSNTDGAHDLSPLPPAP